MILKELIDDYKSCRDGKHPMQIPWNLSDRKLLLILDWIAYKLKTCHRTNRQLFRRRFYDNFCQKCYSYVPETGIKCAYCYFVRPYVLEYLGGDTLCIGFVNEEDLMRFRSHEQFKTSFLTKCLRDKGCVDKDIVMYFFNMDIHDTDETYFNLKAREICHYCFAHKPSSQSECQYCADDHNNNFMLPFNNHVYRYFRRQLGYRTYEPMRKSMNDIDFVTTLLTTGCDNNVNKIIYVHHTVADYTFVTIRDKNGYSCMYAVDDVCINVVENAYSMHSYKVWLLCDLQYENLTREQRVDKLCQYFDFPVERYRAIENYASLSSNDRALFKIVYYVLTTLGFAPPTEASRRRCRNCSYSFEKCDKCIFEYDDYDSKLFRSIRRKLRRLKLGISRRIRI